MNSPLPWKVGVFPTFGGRPEILISDQNNNHICKMGFSAGDPNDPEDAALIVLAVNSHAALVAALKDLLETSDCWGKSVGRGYCTAGDKCPQCRAKDAIELAEKGADHE